MTKIDVILIALYQQHQQQQLIVSEARNNQLQHLAASLNANNRLLWLNASSSHSFKDITFAISLPTTTVWLVPRSCKPYPVFTLITFWLSPSTPVSRVFLNDDDGNDDDYVVDIDDEDICDDRTHCGKSGMNKVFPKHTWTRKENSRALKYDIPSTRLCG
ncbi:hypothetical protein FF38_10534 [Lucilia cuprina]|uniref:Uncharacterized protein n=1 Tax=Lucilia cuprina TaxID=7375 RepID=A0A0L0BZ16_LUCCU|nr:hypothetical protein FF38_10534 [Lucilia cuprina]